MAFPILQPGHYTQLDPMWQMVNPISTWRWGGDAIDKIWANWQIWDKYFVGDYSDPTLEHKIAATYNQYSTATGDTVAIGQVLTGTATGAVTIVDSGSGEFNFDGAYDVLYAGASVAANIHTPVIRITAISGSSSGFVDLNSYTISYTTAASGLYGFTINSAVASNSAYVIFYDYLYTSATNAETGSFYIQQNVSTLNGDSSATAWTTMSATDTIYTAGIKSRSGNSVEGFDMQGLVGGLTLVTVWNY